jgi:PD-(D/E)XK endonuclease
VEHPKTIGDRTTMAVMLALRELGYAVLVPFGENTRYDVVIDDGLSLRRVQCKTGRLRLGSVIFSTCSSYGHHPNPKILRRHYRGQVDFFGVYCPETAGVYLIPIEDLPNQATAALRVLPTRNRQRRRIRWAADYEIAEVAITAGPRVCAGAAGSSA